MKTLVYTNTSQSSPFRSPIHSSCLSFWIRFYESLRHHRQHHSRFYFYVWYCNEGWTKTIRFSTLSLVLLLCWCWYGFWSREDIHWEMRWDMYISLHPLKDKRWCLLVNRNLHLSRAQCVPSAKTLPDNAIVPNNTIFSSFSTIINQYVITLRVMTNITRHSSHVCNLFQDLKSFYWIEIDFL